MITQDNDARAYRNEYEGELMYKVNKDRLYLVNTLKGYADLTAASVHLYLTDRQRSRA